MFLSAKKSFFSTQGFFWGHSEDVGDASASCNPSTPFGIFSMTQEHHNVTWKFHPALPLRYCAGMHTRLTLLTPSTYSCSPSH